MTNKEDLSGNYQRHSFRIDGPNPSYSEAIRSLEWLKANVAPVQIEALNSLIAKTSPDISPPDLVDSQVNFGLRQALTKSDLALIENRITCNSQSLTPYIFPASDKPLAGDCLTTSTIVEQLTHHPRYSERFLFYGHASTSFPIQENFVYQIAGRRIQTISANLRSFRSHTFSLLLADMSKIMLLDTSGFYGGLTHNYYLSLIRSDYFLNNSVEKNLNIVPASTIPLAETVPFVNGGLKPYCEFGNSLINFRLFPINKRFGAQIELTSQPNSDTSGVFPCTSLFVFPDGQQSPVFASQFTVSQKSRYPSLIHNPAPATTITGKMEEQLNTVADEFKKIILPKLNP